MIDSGMGMDGDWDWKDIPGTGVKEGKLQDIMHFGYLFLLFRKA